MKKYKAILFDLDGTLLPMLMDKYVTAYMTSLCAYLAPYGFEPKALSENMWKSIAKMRYNDGTKTNEEAFWDEFTEIYGEKAALAKTHLDGYYSTEYQKVESACEGQNRAKELISLCKEKGFRVFLATNPLFPRVATASRMRWAGLSEDDFELITTYENSHFCKPEPEYYLEVMNRAGIDPEECLMVGNDMCDDMRAAATGCDVYLITDYLENRKNEDYSSIKHGSFEEFFEFVKSL
ncbi:MAG: HAD family hydrolase [Clostridia bacterium]|nr:HAD family hydrolase [Clostridia bacterium]